MNISQENLINNEKLIEKCKLQCDKIIKGYEDQNDDLKPEYEVCIKLIPWGSSVEKMKAPQLALVDQNQNIGTSFKMSQNQLQELNQQIYLPKQITSTSDQQDSNNNNRHLMDPYNILIEDNKLTNIDHFQLDLKSESLLSKQNCLKTDNAQEFKKTFKIEQTEKKLKYDLEREQKHEQNYKTNLNDQQLNCLVQEKYQSKIKQLGKGNIKNKKWNSSQRQNFMKSDYQIAILQSEYAKNQQWTSDFLTQVSIRVGLKRVQVYKWYWDRKEELLKIQKDRLQQLCQPSKKLFKLTRVSKMSDHANQCQQLNIQSQQLFQSQSQEISIFKVYKMEKCTKNIALGLSK
ncbi:UNKNOWN [Stylonychia lemnae]|uniref:Homeobox domain-containing protein n=1 Tax=Stylonychia lemnae TaxID=5949 RepID=A0A078AWW3_STYLE|nr:UNKNOWN [Stylonychia lemnae]|eukprot:CDW86546.1 UNKNOWN [Stylonychia lemnae]